MATITAGTNGSTADGAVYGAENASNSRRANKFTMNSDTTITQVKGPVVKKGSPTDNAEMYIVADASGVPSNTILYTSATIAISTFATGGPTTQTFLFSGTMTLTASATYWIVYARTGASDETNYYEFCHGGLTVAGGNIGVRAGTVWSGNADLSYYYEITTTTPAAATSGKNFLAFMT